MGYNNKATFSIDSTQLSFSYPSPSKDVALIDLSYYIILLSWMDLTLRWKL